MNQAYKENIYILKELIEEELEGLSKKEIWPNMLERAYFGICIMLVGYLAKIIMDKIALEGVWQYPSVKSIMMHKGWANERVAYFLNMLEGCSSLVFVMCLIIGGIFIWLTIDSLFGDIIQSSEWMRYIGVPVIGEARNIVNTYLKDYTYLNQVDFKETKKYLGADYKAYVACYNQIMKEDSPNQEQMKYLLMMNLLAAIADKKGLKDWFERRMLVKEIKHLKKHLSSTPHLL